MQSFFAIMGLLALSLGTSASHVGHRHHRRQALDAWAHPRVEWVTVTAEVTLTSFRVQYITETVTQDSPAEPTATQVAADPPEVEATSSTAPSKTPSIAAPAPVALVQSVSADTTHAAGTIGTTHSSVASDPGAIGVVRSGDGTVYFDGYIPSWFTGKLTSPGWGHVASRTSVRI
jgi:hypothetical protein